LAISLYKEQVNRQQEYLKYQVLTAVTMSITVLWDVKSRNLARTPNNLIEELGQLSWYRNWLQAGRPRGQS
jgi:hypothetical protein